MHGLSSLVKPIYHDARRLLPFEAGLFDACYSHMLYDLWEIGGFVVHLFCQDKVKLLAKGYRVIVVEEFLETRLPKRLYLGIHVRIVLPAVRIHPVP